MPPLDGALVVGVQVEAQVDGETSGRLATARRFAQVSWVESGTLPGPPHVPARVTVSAGERSRRLSGVGSDDACTGDDQEHTASGMRHHLSWLSASPVLEPACGRGELLALLRQAGAAAQGVDLDEGMVRDARAAGHDVELTDALTGLRGRADGSVRGVFSARFVEHLDPAALHALRQSYARLLAQLDPPNEVCVVARAR